MDTDSGLIEREPRSIERIAGRYYVAPRSQRSEGYRQCPRTTDFCVLSEFIERSVPWSDERVPVPGRLRLAFWAWIPLELFWAIWLATILSEASPCDGPICMVATLDRHAAALLACGVFCVAAFVGLIPTTRGFSRCNGTEVVGLAIASAAGGASLLGIAALIIGALIVSIVLATFVLAFTATPRREMDYARSRTPFSNATFRPSNRARARRVGRQDQGKVAGPPRSTLAGVDRDSLGFN
jgi:hypothetical protein